MKGIVEIDVYRELIAAMIVQSGGLLRIKSNAINSLTADMHVVQTVDPETGDILLGFHIEEDAE